MSIKGFTVIELLLSVSIIALMAGVMAPVFVTLQRRTDLDTATAAFVAELRQAQTLSTGMDGDTSWGVAIATSNITLFRGTSFAARDAAFDESFGLSSAIAVSGATEVVFAKFTGYPAGAATTTLSTAQGDTRTITVNSLGMVNY